jgi:predicted transcriptional regulator
MSTPQHLNVNVKLRIDAELRDALETLARAAERTISQEMRRALREHVAKETA